MIENADTRRADAFLFHASLVLLVFCVGSFTLRAMTNPPTMARLDLPLVFAHAALMTVWLTAFAWQIWLKRSRNLPAHMAFGSWIAWLAAPITIVGVTISFNSAREFGEPLFFLLNAAIFLVFGILVLLAIRAAIARNFATHKRYMLVATLTFAGPASARLLPVIGLPPMLGPLVLIVLVLLVPLVYDRMVGSSWHRASRFASLLVVGTIFAMIALGFSPAAGALRPFFASGG